jgi:UDP-perosamine 4-acetyltransferase
MKYPNLPIILLGSGGHAKILHAILVSLEATIQGVVDPDPSKAGTSFCGSPVLGNDDQVFSLDPGKALLVNGVGSTGNTDQRKLVFEKFTKKGFRFFSVIHSSAVVFPDVEIGEGVQILPGAIVQPGSTLGANVLVNTGSIVGHDCKIGDHTHLAPGSILSGGVTIEQECHIGTGASILQQKKVGQGSIVGANSLVVRDVPPRSKVIAPLARTLGI